MNKIEALHKCLDGAKIKCSEWSCPKVNGFVIFDGGKFVYQSDVTEQQEATVCLKPQEGWFFIPKHVDFQTALKAYKNSKRIKSVSGEIYSLHCEDDSLCVVLSEIEEPWLILG